MIVVRSLAAFLVCLVCLAGPAPAGAQELRVKEGVDANLRSGPGSDATLTRKLTPGEKLRQTGRDGDWIRVENGYVQAASVEWTMPLAPRGKPMTRIGSNKALDSTARKATTSPNDRLLAATGLSDESQITIFDTGSLQLLTQIGIPAGFNVTEISFIDDNTLLLTDGTTRDGIVELSDPKEQVVIDVDSGEVIRRGAPLFGYLSRNHTDRDGTILSFTGSRVFRHDPSTYEILDSIDIACTDCELTFQRSLDDVQVSREGRISAAARIGKYPKKHFYTYSTDKGLADLGSHIANLNNGAESLTSSVVAWYDHHFYGFIPQRNVVVSWEIPDDSRTGTYGYIYRLFNTETAELIDSFVSPSFYKPLICPDNLDILASRMELGPDGVQPESLTLRNKTYEAYELASIRFDPASGKPDITRLARTGKSFGMHMLCLDEGRRLFLGHDKVIVDVRSTPQKKPFSLPPTSSGYGRFEMRIDDAPILFNGVASGNNDDLDLDKLTMITRPPLSPNALRTSRSGGFAGPDGHAVLLSQDKRRGVWFMNDAGEISALPDAGARSVWAPDVRSTNGASFLVMEGARRLAIASSVSRKLVSVTGLSSLEKINTKFGDDRYMAEDSGWSSVNRDDPMFAFDYSGEYLYVQERGSGVLEKVSAATGEKIEEIKSEIPCKERLSLTTQGGLIACVSKTGILIGDIETGRLIAEIETERTPYSLALDASGKYLFARDGFATLVYGVASKQLLASLYTVKGPREDLGNGRFRITGPDKWLLLTPEGFYTGDADAQLRVSYGVERTYPIDKFRNALYRPDLVAEALKGDPEGLVRQAAAKVSLEKILKSGAAPEITIKGELQGERVRAEARIKDSGGGIGRIEWRVNGVVQETGEGRTSDVAELFLAGGDNRIELVAYNRGNTIQGRSEALSFSVADDSVGPPRLFVLTIGVDDYKLDQLKLKYAARDAEAVAAAFEKAGAGLYGEVFVDVLADGEVTRAALEAKFRELAKSVRPNDVFVFFSAGHGKTLDGRFFFIPQDFSGTTLASIRDQGIGHATWLEWFSLIPAQKSLLLFDSCESGSLTETVVGRELRFRAANDLLGNATGRALIAASSGTGVALEGYKNQGVFAWSVIDALSNADRDADGLIDIDELAGSIEETVPRIAEEAFGEKQTPQFKAPMKGFDVARPLAADIR